MKDAEKRDGERYKRQIRPKHTIKDIELFAKDKAKVGGLILEGMKTTGGTDIDWLIEHRGGFIIMEFKEFHDNRIRIPLGQMIAFEKLHERLTLGGKCYFLIFGSDEDMDFKNPESSVWFFEMIDWKSTKIAYEEISNPKRYLVEKKSMKEIQIKDFRKTIEVYWKEFEQ